MRKSLYRVEEVAELLCVGRCTVYRLVARGELYSVKIGRYRWIPAAAIERFLTDLTESEFRL